MSQTTKKSLLDYHNIQTSFNELINAVNQMYNAIALAHIELSQLSQEDITIIHNIARMSALCPNNTKGTPTLTMTNTKS